MDKKLPIVLIVTIFLAGGIFVWKEKKQTGISSVQNQGSETLGEEMQKQTQTYPQHIEIISGNTDEVWYNIPELGVRMKLNREFAEDLIYMYSKRKDSIGEEWEAVYFSNKTIMAIDSGCSPEDGSPLGAISKLTEERASSSEFYGIKESNYVNIQGHYYDWRGPQAICWSQKNETEIKKALSEKYAGSGVKHIQEGIKTLQLIPSE